MLPCDDVIYLVPKVGIPLVNETILAEPVSTRSNLPPKRCWDF